MVTDAGPMLAESWAGGNDGNEARGKRREAGGEEQAGFGARDSKLAVGSARYGSNSSFCVYPVAAAGRLWPAAASQNRTTTIAVVPKGTTHEFWKSVHAGAIKAGREFDVEILWQGPLREDDREDQIKVVDTLVNRGIDGLLLAPLDDKALRQPVSNAVRAGIPVVIFDSRLDSDEPLSLVSTSNLVAGRLAGHAPRQGARRQGQRHHDAAARGRGQHDGPRAGLPRRHRDVPGHHGGQLEPVRRRARPRARTRRREPARVEQGGRGQRPGHLHAERVDHLRHAARPGERRPGGQDPLRGLRQLRQAGAGPARRAPSTASCCRTRSRWATSASRRW